MCTDEQNVQFCFLQIIVDIGRKYVKEVVSYYDNDCIRLLKFVYTITTYHDYDQWYRICNGEIVYDICFKNRNLVMSDK